MTEKRKAEQVSNRMALRRCGAAGADMETTELEDLTIF